MARKLTPMGIAVLELLHERPMHPYEMTQVMRVRHVDIRVKIRTGSLYHTVDRLETDGLIEVVNTQRDGRRPERTVYGLTDSGLDAFRARARELLSTIAEEFPEYASGLAVLDDLDREDALTELRLRAIRLAADVASGHTISAGLRKRELPEIYWLDWRYHLARREFELHWTERLLEDIESGRVAWQRTDKAALELLRFRQDAPDAHPAGDKKTKDGNGKAS